MRCVTRRCPQGLGVRFAPSSVAFTKGDVAPPGLSRGGKAAHFATMRARMRSQLRAVVTCGLDEKGGESGVNTGTKRRVVPLLPLAGHHRLPAHGEPAVRRARALDQRARRGDDARQGDLPRRAEERQDERAVAGRHLPDRDARHRDAAAPLARRNREGARRGKATRASIKKFAQTDEYFLVEVDEMTEVAKADRRGGSLDAERAGRVRDVREAEQEGSARSPDERADHRRSGAPRRTPSSPTCRP